MWLFWIVVDTGLARYYLEDGGDGGGDGGDGGDVELEHWILIFFTI